MMEKEAPKQTFVASLGREPEMALTKGRWRVRLGGLRSQQAAQEGPSSRPWIWGYREHSWRHGTHSTHKQELSHLAEIVNHCLGKRICYGALGAGLSCQEMATYELETHSSSFEKDSLKKVSS